MRSVLMKRKDLTGQVNKIQSACIGYGGLGDVYKGEWRAPDAGQCTIVSENDWFIGGRPSITF
jgi:hypothetical protein